MCLRVVYLQFLLRLIISHPTFCKLQNHKIICPVVATAVCTVHVQSFMVNTKRYYCWDWIKSKLLFCKRLSVCWKQCRNKVIFHYNHFFIWTRTYTLMVHIPSLSSFIEHDSVSSKPLTTRHSILFRHTQYVQVIFEYKTISLCLPLSYQLKAGNMILILDTILLFPKCLEVHNI